VGFARSSELTCPQETPALSLPLGGALFTHMADEREPFCFQLTIQDRVYKFACSSAADLQDWLEVRAENQKKTTTTTIDMGG
jgi:hypothetical protein